MVLKELTYLTKIRSPSRGRPSLADGCFCGPNWRPCWRLRSWFSNGRKPVPALEESGRRRQLLPRRLGVGGRIGHRISKALLHFLLKFRGVGNALVDDRLPAIAKSHRPARRPAAAPRNGRLSASCRERQNEREP